MKIPLFLATLAISAASMVVSVSSIAATALVKISGDALVAANGMTAYTFDADKAGSGKSVCNCPCASSLWPPLMAAVDQPAGDYSVVTRDDGARQVAYKGKPLYFYRADQKAGDRTGDNFKDVWHIIKE
jgi:predicted lipoprotein with Yx(FWY)xxD motif